MYNTARYHNILCERGGMRVKKAKFLKAPILYGLCLCLAAGAVWSGGVPKARAEGSGKEEDGALPLSGVQEGTSRSGFSNEGISYAEYLEAHAGTAAGAEAVLLGTDALAGTELLIPEHSCQRTVWNRIRARAFRMITSRYATAAAAVALALTLIWGGDPAAFAERFSVSAGTRDYAVAERFDGWTERWNDTLSQTIAHVSGFLDGLGRMDLS